MIISTLASLDDVPEELQPLRRRRSGASKAYALWHVQIRAALPGIITGMRIAMGGAWGSIVAAEMLAATSGVGFLIVQAGNYLNTAIVFSGIITIALMELALDSGLRLAGSAGRSEQAVPTIVDVGQVDHRIGRQRRRRAGWRGRQVAVTCLGAGRDDGRGRGVAARKP